MIFVDTNYFLRYLLNDGSNQHKKATKLFLDASQGNKDLITSNLVIFEIMWVLESTYKLNKYQMINTIQKILDMSFLRLREREILYRSLELYKNVSFEFEDCFNVTFSKENHVKDFATFDKKIKRFLSL